MKLCKILLDVPSFIGIAFGCCGTLIFFSTIMFGNIPALEETVFFLPLLLLPIAGVLAITRGEFYLLIEAILIYALILSITPILGEFAQDLSVSGEDITPSTLRVLKFNAFINGFWSKIAILTVLLFYQFIRLAINYISTRNWKK